MSGGITAIAVRVVGTADNHLGRHYDRMYPQRLEERRAWLRRGFSGAVDHALETGAHLFLIAGDLFDSPDPRNIEREYVAEALARLRSAGVRCLAISGNHDTPRSRGSQSPATPLGSYASLGGMRLLRGSGEIDTELMDVAGVRLAVGGMAPDPTLPPGSDPLDGVTWDHQAELSILLLHGGLEGHIYPGAPEAIFRRATAEALGADCLLVGHVHKHAAFRWGESTVVVPGSTERMTFGDLGSQPGFVEMELEPGRPVRVRHLPVECQPRAQITLPARELRDGDPHQAVLTCLEPLLDRETMVRLCLEGPITRQRYHDLRPRELAEFGSARGFFFDLDTSGLFVEDELAQPVARGGRLSQREELIRYCRERVEAGETPGEVALRDEALDAILEAYG